MSDFVPVSNSHRCMVRKLTPSGRAAIATLEVRGEGAADTVDAFFRSHFGKRASELALGRIAVGLWSSGSTAAEELVVCRRSANVFEVNCHGGELAGRRILADLRSIDVVSVADDPNGRDEQTVALQLLQQARTSRTAGILLDQYRGALSAALKGIQTAEQAKSLLRYAELGRHLVVPWRVVLAGPTNVGKSSLMNALLGYQRAIVFDQPGTTRDAVTAVTVLDGWPVEFIDTAGLRSSDDEIERQGMQLTHQQAKSADLVLQVFDARETPPVRSDSNRLLVANKTDLLAAESFHLEVIFTSALTGQGIESLIQAIVQELVPDPPPAGAAIPLTEESISYLRAYGAGKM